MSKFTYQFNADLYKGSVTVNTDLFINNEWISPLKPDTIQVTNPSNGETLTQVSAGLSEDVDVAVKAARKAFKTTWGLNAPAARRAELLLKLASLVEQHIDQLAALETLNAGIPHTMTKHSMITMAVQALRYYAGLAATIHGNTVETNPAKFAYTRREPSGVVAAITPWNVPFITFIAKLAPALACGCTVVSKPSEITPFTALYVCDLIKEAGFPPGVVNVVVGYGPTVGSALTHHPDVNHVSFTGSLAVGRQIIKAAGESNLKRVSLELGGKSPNIILDDADLDQALKWTETGLFSLSGQMCSAGSRIFVQEGIYDQFMEKFVALAKARILGDPLHTTTVQGPQVSKTQFDRVMGYIAAGKSEGATIVTGGEQHGSQGFFIQPTIFTDVKPDMKIVREEIFGPVGVVVKFKTDDEVIEMANDTTYGLASAVFTSNITRAIKISNSIEAGTVFVNCHNWGEIYLPWGGYKQSGWGQENGEEALKAYTEVKAVHINIGMQL